MDKMVEHTSRNFDERKLPVSMLVIHYTETRSDRQALEILTDGASANPVSAHYLGGRFGRVYMLVDESRRAWHAGRSFWDGIEDCNSASVGIELVNDGAEPFPEPQVAALAALCAEIVGRHSIAPRNVVGHSDVAPRRKRDPGELFPWRRLAACGIGLWTDSFASPFASQSEMLSEIGYDVSDEAAALSAFQRHYFPEAILEGSTRTPERLAAVCSLVKASRTGLAW